MADGEATWVGAEFSAYLFLEEQFPITDSDFRKWGHRLVGITEEELDDIDRDILDNAYRHYCFMEEVSMVSSCVINRRKATGRPTRKIITEQFEHVVTVGRIHFRLAECKVGDIIERRNRFAVIMIGEKARGALATSRVNEVHVYRHCAVQSSNLKMRDGNADVTGSIVFEAEDYKNY